ncbi:MAG: hypothetical protein ACREF4_15070 [Gammaproteobacteria bacterium]
MKKLITKADLAKIHERQAGVVPEPMFEYEPEGQGKAATREAGEAPHVDLYKGRRFYCGG